jgi:hypothetical protein
MWKGSRSGVGRVGHSCHRRSGLTLKLPTAPNAHRKMVETNTEPRNATLPSTVFPPAADHRTFPTLLPTIEASASPTPSDRTPKYARISLGPSSHRGEAHPASR